MKAKDFKVLERAIEEGVNFGLSRAYKHTENPGDGIIKDNINREVLNEICEMFTFDDA